MYAVIETGSKQYRVSAGDTLKIERLAAEKGASVTFDRVLLVNADGKVTVGAPTVTGASILADVVDHIRGEHKLTFKMKRRKGYHKSIGHRQELTVVKVKEIKTAADQAGSTTAGQAVEAPLEQASAAPADQETKVPAPAGEQAVPAAA